MSTVAITSINNYHSLIKGKKENTESELVLNALEQIQPASGRMVYVQLNKCIEISSVARCLNWLKKHNKIMSPYNAKCKITDINVQFYILKKYEIFYENKS